MTGALTAAENQATVEAFGAALERAAAGFAKLDDQWQRAGVTVSQTIRQQAQGWLIESAFAQAPRHRVPPYPVEVVRWISMNAGTDLAGRLGRVYAAHLGTRVPEVCMRRTRDNGVHVLRPGWPYRVTMLRRARRRAERSPVWVAGDGVDYIRDGVDG